MNWMVPERRLGEQQLDVLRRCGAADPRHRGHHWIRGFAGTGKTVLLVHLAGRILAERHEASICLASYTHALKDLMASGLGPDLAGRARVMTYYQLLHEGRKYDWILLDEVQDIPAAGRSRRGGRRHRPVDLRQVQHRERDSGVSRPRRGLAGDPLSSDAEGQGHRVLRHAGVAARRCDDGAHAGG